MNLSTAAARLESHIRGWRADGMQVSDALWAADAAVLEVRIASPSWQIPLTVIQLYESGHARALFLSPTDPIEERHRIPSLDAWNTLLTETVTRAARVRHKLIPFAGMAAARLHGGVTTSGMEVVMTDGTRHKLLWATLDPARRLLRERLLPLLGARLSH